MNTIAHSRELANLSLTELEMELIKFLNEFKTLEGRHSSPLTNIQLLAGSGIAIMHGTLRDICKEHRKIK